MGSNEDEYLTSEMHKIGLDNISRVMSWVELESEERLKELSEVSINMAFVIVNDMITRDPCRVDDMIAALKTMFLWGYLTGSGADIPDVFKEA